ncbi:MAG: HepT-like ribonuclease domain-containing protein [Tepidisphaeraceae bacterium]|jgi:uncharacterized protein with HEPN domain
MPRDEETNRISDRIRFEHIAAAARDIATMTAGRTRADLDGDMILRRAVIHAVQEIGEAAARMSDEGRAIAPSIPWGSIVQMRNIMVHVYWGVDLNRVWRVASEQVRGLIPLAEQAIQKLPLPPDSGDAQRRPT